jgi:acyl carrier protein
MSTDEFLRDLESQFELDPNSLSVELRLEDLKAWDSMAAMGFIALADRLCSVQVTGDQLSGCQTVQDLLTLLPLDDQT